MCYVWHLASRKYIPNKHVSKLYMFLMFKIDGQVCVGITVLPGQLKALFRWIELPASFLKVM